MTRIVNPLSLLSVQVCAYGADCDVANNYPGWEFFDDRHDFPMGLSQSSLAVLMCFVNERRLDSDDAPGIRRQASVILTDATEGRVMSSVVIHVRLGRGEFSVTRRADLPFAYSDIDPDHTFKVLVRDESNKRILGYRIFRMFDEVRCGRDAGSWFEARQGGVSQEQNGAMYKSYDFRPRWNFDVRFDLLSRFHEDPPVMPDLEIKVRFPDGSEESRFCTPVCDDFEADQYHVVMQTCISSDKRRGVCYAELSCVGHPVAGFVFGSVGPSEAGVWTDDGLKCLEEPSPEAACERFRALTSRDAEPAEGSDDIAPCSDDDEFGRALDEFIGSVTDADTDVDADAGEELFPVVEPSPLSRLDDLTGLESVKAKLAVYEQVVRFNKMRRDNNLPSTSLPLHAMFLGSPGTGKTTVAKMIGRMLADAGVLSRGHVVVKERANLLGPYYSTEATNTLQAIEEAEGGILLIDEAYQLCQPDDPRDPGKFVIEALMTALADESRRDWMLILAGYPDEMRRMFEINPGFKSRIPESNIYVFDDFTEAELLEIAERYLDRNRYSLSAGAREALAARIGADCSCRDKTFGNARYVVNMIQTDILPAMAVRVSSSGACDLRSLSEIKACDVRMPVRDRRSVRPRVGFVA